MKTRTLAILAAVLVVVTLVAAWPSLMGSDDTEQVASGPNAPDFSGITAASVDEVRIQRPPEDEVVLERDGTTWTVEGEEVPGERIEELFADVEELVVGELVARSTDNHQRLGVSSATAQRITFVIGDEERTILIGTMTPGGGGFHARPGGADEVHEVSGTLLLYLQRDATAWVEDPDDEDDDAVTTAE